MCGIAGFFHYRKGLPPDTEGLRRMLESVRYRGPDHLGIFSEGEIAIGNVRLAILDTSDRGNQPIFNEDNSVVVVYNGEIYNFPELRKTLEEKGHRFRTDTDTEALVHLYEEYGLGMAERLNGMFAFALFDRQKRSLVIARDRTGQKPLYLHWNKDGLVFCSELKALLPYLDSRMIDAKALREFFSLGYALEPGTMLHGVEALEPGTIMDISGAAQHKKTFWQPLFPEKAPAQRCADHGLFKRRR